MLSVSGKLGGGGGEGGLTLICVDVKDTGFQTVKSEIRV